jgi:glutamate synthase (NADPH/NADH) small chain
MMDRSSLTPSENTPLDYAAWCASNEQALEVLASFERGLAENAAADPESSVDLASGLQRLREEMDAHQAFEASELLPILDELGAEALREQLLEDHDEIARLASGPALPEAGWRLARLIREHLATQERLLLPLLKGRKFWPATAVEEDGYLILEKRLVGPETWSFVVLAPQVARGRKPGQFFMVAPFSNSERIPLTLAGGDARRGWIRFVMQEAGSTTQAMGRLSAGDRLYAVAGPLGTPTELVDHGTVVLVGGGYGSAAILPAAEALHAKGRRVLTILGGRSRERVLLAEELAAASSELVITTDDGSWGRKAIVTEPLKEILEREPVAQVVAVGPVPMMQAVAELTRPYGVFTLVSLNALMVDGTGMCGGCRVSVGGAVKFACFDGPDFDGHQVDFGLLRQRQSWYREEEAKAKAHVCNLGLSQTPITEAQLPAVEPALVYPADFDWRREDLANLKASQRLQIHRQQMAVQDADARVGNFQEVNLGFTADQARLESARCLQCKKPGCVEACPVGIDIPGFIQRLSVDDVSGAARILKESSSLPAVCGRVCPQERQCESKCIVGVKGEAVSIGRLERFAAESLLAEGAELPPVAPATGRTVAVAGAGPAGLTVAGELARKGHAVTVFDALHKPGGVLLYGIPEFRLPNRIVDAEVDALRRMGVRFVMNTLVGRSMTLAELREEFDAVFMGTGAGLPRMLGVPGEDRKGVYTANEFLTRINLMGANRFPDHGTPVTVGEHIVVVGCGNTAMDCARAARRMGRAMARATGRTTEGRVSVVYRRTEQESTARIEEIEHAKEEGVEFLWLTNPIAVGGDEGGWVRELECAVMELGEAGPDGRRRPVDTGRRVVLPCDTLIVALGFGVNPLIAQTEARLRTLKGGLVEVDEATGETSVPGVFAGGDVITGGATVILAMGQGRRAAEAMDRYLSATPQ